MGYLTFDGVDDYAVGTGTPLVTAPPYFLVACCRPVGAGSFSSLISLADSSSTSGFVVLRLQSLAPAMALSSPVISAIGAATLRQGGAWHILVGCQYAASHIRVFCGQVGGDVLQAMDSVAAATVPGAVNEVTLGRRGGSSPSNYGQDDIAWAGIGAGCPTVPEIRELIRSGAPLEVLRGRLRHFWPIVGGSVEPDVLGGLDLTVSGAVYTAGGDALGQVRPRPPAPTLARALRALQGRVSVGSAWYEARVPVMAGQRHVGVVKLDQAGNLVSVEVDGTDSDSAATSGTHNAQSGALVVGAELVDGVAQSVAEEGRVGIAGAYASVLTGTDLAQARALAAGWLAPSWLPGEDLAAAELTATATGTTSLDLSALVQDPAGAGWEISAANLVGTGASVAIGSSGKAIEIGSVTAAIGSVLELDVSVRGLVPSAVRVAVPARLRVTVGTGAWPNGYRWRRRCLVPPERVVGGPHSGFVVRVATTATWLKSKANGGELEVNGGLVDIRFESEADALLGFEIESYDEATGALEAWVRLASLSGSADNRWWLYYGKSLEGDDDQDPASCWQDYLAVWDPRTGRDRTGNGRDLTPTAAIGAATLVGPAGQFDGTLRAQGQTIDWLAGHAAITWECWLRPDAAMLATERGWLVQGPLTGSDSGGNGLMCRIDAVAFRSGNADTLLCYLKVGSDQARWEGQANLKAELAGDVHFAFTWASAVQPRVLLDGVEQTAGWWGKVVSGTATQNSTLSGTTNTQTDQPVAFGAASLGDMLGVLDEPRVRAAALSAAFLQTQRRSHTDPEGFFSIGGANEAADATAAPVAAPLRVAATGGVVADFDVVASAYDPDGTVTLTSAGTPPQGTASIASGQLRYTPPASFVGEARWTYTIGDGTASASAVIVVDVAAPAPGSSTSADSKAFNDEWVGCDGFCINLGNVKINSGTRRIAVGKQVPMTGSIKAFLVEMASSKASEVGQSNAKSAGTGLATVDWEVCRGKAPTSADSGSMASRPSTVLATGSKTHDRGTTGGNGDQRRVHRFDFSAQSFTKGDFIFLTLLNGDGSPSTSYISYNGPAMKSGDAVEAFAPFGASPARRISPFAGDHGRMLLQERTTADTWLRRGEFMPQVTLVYDLGNGEELKIGDPFRQGNNFIRNLAVIGGQAMVRIRFKATSSWKFRECWNYCHWLKSGGKPAGNLLITVTEDAGAWGSGYTKQASIAPSSNTAGADPAADVVQCWSEAADGTYPWWSKATFASDVEITQGRTYEIRWTAPGATGTQRYKLHPIMVELTFGNADDDSHAASAVLGDDPAAAGKQAWGQFSSNAGQTWTGFRFDYDAATVQRKDVTLPILMKKL